MMKVCRLYLLCAILLSAFFCATAFPQEDMVAVDRSAFNDPQRPAAAFHHDAHNEKAGLEDCSACHHLYEDGKLVTDESSEDQSCSDCHSLKSLKAVPGLRKAFHTQCITCHKQKKKGPLLCGECHLKNPPK